MKTKDVSFETFQDLAKKPLYVSVVDSCGKPVLISRAIKPSLVTFFENTVHIESLGADYCYLTYDMFTSIFPNMFTSEEEAKQHYNKLIENIYDEAKVDLEHFKYNYTLS